ncbi:Glycosyltransferase involved in cell wall bisynthesis [Lachnospiraceae bacterium A10]|nr:Glycosyltransferase involved in cell wall bisynthesis [Lachnospiraceae bacterium A10]
MKLISFAVPCYNSSEYMTKCIESILPGGDDIEILIVDDGSTDRTAQIADAYEEKYPGICRAIHQENGGHGEAVNTGLKNATGLYYKVVDSDDWLDYDAYMDVLRTLKRLVAEGTPVDMLLTNYVYEKVYTGHQRRMVYRYLFPENTLCGWEDMKHNIKGFTILMHSVIYRTEMLRECGLKLPKHTFYVDNLFVYEPLPYVKTIYYLDVDFYRYFIGRAGQSVAEQTMIKRIDQQLRVNYRMVDAIDLWSIEEEHLRKYMLGYLEMITVVSTSIGYLSKTQENLDKIQKLWDYIKEKDARTYHELRFGLFGGAMRLPGRVGRGISLRLYHISQKFMGFN